MFDCFFFGGGCLCVSMLLGFRCWKIYTDILIGYTNVPVIEQIQIQNHKTQLDHPQVKQQPIILTQLETIDMKCHLMNLNYLVHQNLDHIIIDLAIVDLVVLPLLDLIINQIVDVKICFVSQSPPSLMYIFSLLLVLYLFYQFLQNLTKD